MSPHFYRVVKEIYGYKNVHAFYAGFPTWQQTGLPVITEPEFLKFMVDEGGSFVLVDLRSPEVAAREHIPGAVNYPLSSLEGLFNDLPDDKKETRVIFYSDNMDDAKFAHRTLRVNGFDSGYILNEGIQGWKSRGYPTASNALAKEIVYTKKPLPGTVSVAEFENVMKLHEKDKIILDVRSAGEVMSGMFPGALGIPIDTLDSRWQELPKDKEYLAQCKAGNRARMAYMILKDHGFKVRYLDANVKIEKDGSYKIKAR